MTHVEAIKYVLEELGGRAQLKELYPRVIKLVSFKEGSNIQATLRTALQRHPKYFKRSAGMPDGWWELATFQEEMAKRNRRIKELEEEVARLKTTKTEEDFVKRLVKETKTLFGVTRKPADYVRQVLLHLGRDEEQEELMAWIERRDQKPDMKSTKKIIQKISNSQVFNGSISESEFNGGGTTHEG